MYKQKHVRNLSIPPHCPVPALTQTALILLCVKDYTLSRFWIEVSLEEKNWCFVCRNDLRSKRWFISFSKEEIFIGMLFRSGYLKLINMLNSLAQIEKILEYYSSKNKNVIFLRDLDEEMSIDQLKEFCELHCLKCLLTE